MRPIVERLAELTGLRDRDALDVSLLSALAELSGARRVALHRLVGEDPGRRWLMRAHVEAAAAGGHTEVQIEPLWADLRGQPRFDERPDWCDCLLSQQARAWRPTEATSLFPLWVDETPVAIIELETAQALTPTMRKHALALLQVMRNQLGMLDYSERDTLTSLLNRKSFDESFYRASAPLPVAVLTDDEARRRESPLRYWLAVVDIDHFKLVNDGFGHLIGDEVLLLVARVMRGSFRFYDQLYRFGGEEFVLLLRCGTEHDAMLAFERFRTRVEAYLFPQVKHITVSIGFTDVRTGDSPTAAVERADQAVYYAKHNGRNQVRCREALRRDGLLADEEKSSDVELF
ncbi:GGDEF domain-containing protein [Ideonella azotifigens]|uniref:diguanylate cyclase n=1 Tax=Ideonella azotifigens TaxID=513160 RepID=A0ABP3VTT0_9BURK|nr:GGDEF domain-containing protein [Ideonella azotifigens]MCD2339581.1 GGDEF domain-containing protein [Ideonella azotifigens]